MLVVTRHAWPLLTRLVGQGQRGQLKRSLVLRTRPINYPMLPSYLAVEMLETGRLVLSQLCYFGPTRQSRTGRPGIPGRLWETLGDVCAPPSAQMWNLDGEFRGTRIHCQLLLHT